MVFVNSRLNNIFKPIAKDYFLSIYRVEKKFQNS